MNTIGSAIYIDTGINDYYDNDNLDGNNKTTNNIIGGQVCINPIFAIPTSASGTTTPNTTMNTISNNDVIDTTASTPLIVKPKSMIHNSNNNNEISSSKSNTVQRHTNRRAVVVRKRQQQQQRTDSDVPVSFPSSTTTTPNNTTSNNNLDANQQSTTTTNKNATTSATMSDCLACSGCITTTETIFLQEQYNVQKLQRDILLLPSSSSSSSDRTVGSLPNNSTITTRTTSLPDQEKNRRRPFIVVSISSASMADLCRYLLSEPSSNSSSSTNTTTKNDNDQYSISGSGQEEYYRVLQQLTIALYRYCHVQVVLDATITTHLTKQLALHEFIMQYNTNPDYTNGNSNDYSSSSSSQQFNPELQQHQQQNQDHDCTNTDDNKNHMNIQNDVTVSLDKTSYSNAGSNSCNSGSSSDEMAEHRRKEQMYEQLLYPSIAVSAYETQYWIPPSTTTTNTSSIATTPATSTKTRTEIVNRSTCTIRQSSSSSSSSGHKQQPQQQQRMPIISSSCPAIICLIEKSYPQFVPHLSTVVSPMIAISTLFLSTLASNWMMTRTTTTTTTTSDNDASGNNNMNTEMTTNSWKDDHHSDIGYDDKDKELQEEDNDYNEYYHLSIMPCHDKKLEASRNDFKYPSTSGSIATNKKSNSLRPAVDMVITTMELIQLLHEAIIAYNNNNNNDEDSTKYLDAMNEIDSVNQKINTKINDSNNHEDDDIVRKTILSIPVHSTSSASEIYPSISLIDCKSLISTIATPFTFNSGHKNDHRKKIQHNSSVRLVKCWIESKVREIQRLQPINGINSPIDLNTLGPLLFTLVPRKLDHSVVLQSPTTTSIPRSISSPTAPSSYFITGSGGYADYLFRSVALHVFNIVDCPIDIWCPVTMTNDSIGAKNILPTIERKSGALPPTAIPPTRVRKMSARTARYSKQREYYEALIYQNPATKQYYIPTTSTTSTMMNSADDNINVHRDTIVLRFVIVYGMSTVQNVLTKLTTYSDVDSNNNRMDQKKKQRIDYIECMACAQSCLNGNGQIRTTTMKTTGDKNVVQQREAPSDSRLRVQRSQHFYPINSYDNTMLRVTPTNEEIVDNTSDSISQSPTFDSCRGDNDDSQFLLNDPTFYTRYHVVPPMQHTMGVSAGIAVQDTMW